MYGNNTIHTTSLIFTNHVNKRILQRNIPNSGIEMARIYGTETIDRGVRKITIDYEACKLADEDGQDIFPIFSLTIVVSEDNVLKTAYFKNEEY